MSRAFVYLGVACWLSWFTASASLAAEPPLRVLFLGDNGPHHPAARFRELQPGLAKRGIELVYTDRVEDLNPARLAEFQGLVIYANTTEISQSQEQALLDYVASGHGFIPLHCASYCFLNSPKYIELVGGQFQKHNAGVFRVEQTQARHPILNDFQSFESWDETYVHTKHNERNRTVLEVRVAEGAPYSGRKEPDPPAGTPGEPWTWVRTHGEGRVFYTAWGHDDRTWTNPGFQNLVERGIRWACGDDPAKAGPYLDRPEMTPPDPSAKPTELVDAQLPFYPAGERWGTLGEPITKMQAPLDAAESLRHISVPVGFRPELVATEPEIGKPLALNWDERGRLWITETVDYPNELQPEGEGRDRIRICEDTDGDGRADKFTIFAERLSIPTSLAFAYGGVIVHQAPHTLFLRDTDGDDQADQREILFTGWNVNDTHAGPSNLQYGLDGWYYGIVGYSGFEGEIAGEQQRFQTGFYRFKLAPPADSKAPPTVAKFEFLRNTNNNSWGVGISEEGIIFGSTANGNPSEYMPIANRYYERVRGWSSTVLGGIALDNWMDPIVEIRQVDWHGGFTAGSGHALYTARLYPREYWNRTAFVAEPTGHLVATFTIQPSGAGFRSRNSWNLLVSSDEWTAPIAAEVGPDGHVWLIDWYNIVVQHNPTPVGFETGKGNAYVTDLRDKKHGRIYRVVYQGDDALKKSEAAFGTDRVKPLNLSNATDEQLVAALRHTNFFWRRHAQRMLIERGGAGVTAALLDLIRTSQPDAGEEFVPAAAHALAVLHDLPVAEQAAAQAAVEGLKHPSAGVRRNAVIALPPSEYSLAAIETAGVLGDPDAQVRLATLLKIADVSRCGIGGRLAAQAIADPVVQDDRYLLQAATSAAAVHGTATLQELVSVDVGKLQQENVLRLLAILGEHIARGAEANDLQLALPLLVKLDPAVSSPVLEGLAKGWPKDKPTRLDADDDQRLAALFKQSSTATRTVLLTLASRLGSHSLDQYAVELTDAMLQLVRNADKPDEQRVAAARQLIDFRRNDAAAAVALLDEINLRTSPALAEGLCEAAGVSNAPEALQELASRMKSFTPGLRAVAIRTLLSRVDGAAVYLDAVEQGDAQLSDLALDQKQALAAHPDQKIAARAKSILEQGGGLPNPDRQKVIDEFLAITEEHADAAAGREVFKKQCAKCHMHSGEGTKIGPDLTGMAVHPKHELLVHLLDPSRSVEGNYRSYTVATAEGRVLTGLLASESRTAIELFDSEGKKQVVQREDIEEFVASPKSLMPEGFEKQMTREELSNLLEFLTQRGQYLPLPIDKVATAVSTRGMFVFENADAERLIFRDWSPKTFKGVPFYLVDPQGARARNAIVLHSPNGEVAAKMPKSVRLLCNSPAKSIHLLSGVAGWAHPYGEDGSVSMIVRLHFADGTTEDHELKNGVEMADYIRRVDVPGSEFAYALRGQQIRYLSITPNRLDPIHEIEFVKGPDNTAPVVMAVTVETR